MTYDQIYPDQSDPSIPQQNPVTDLITTKTTPKISESTAVTMMQGLTLQDYISMQINDKLQEHSKQIQTQIQEVRHSVTESINSQIQTLRQDTNVPVLRQRAEALAPQLVNLKKQIKIHNNEAKKHTGTAPEDWQENKAELCEEHQRLLRIYNNIIQESHSLNLNPKDLGLPDFPQGPA
jgi:uncharacterized protein HemX